MPIEIKRIDPKFVFASGRSLHRTWCYLPPCEFRPSGLGPPEGFPSDSIAVWTGFSNVFDGGWREGESLDWLFRGGVQFDLDWFQMWFGKDRYLLLTAVLEFWQQPPHDACESYVHFADGDWAHGSLDNYLIPIAGSPAHYIDMIPPFTAPTDGSLAGQVRINVTPEVTQWLTGERLNRGFCFTGSDESMAEDSNDSCINQFRLFKLELTYLTFPAAHAASASIKPRVPHTSERRVQSMIGGRVPDAVQERLRRPVPRKKPPPHQ